MTRTLMFKVLSEKQQIVREVDGRQVWKTTRVASIGGIEVVMETIKTL